MKELEEKVEKLQEDKERLTTRTGMFKDAAVKLYQEKMQEKKKKERAKEKRKKTIKQKKEELNNELPALMYTVTTKSGRISKRSTKYKIF